MLFLYLRNSNGFPLTTGEKSPNVSAWWSGSSPHATLPTSHTVPARFHWAGFITPRFFPLRLVHAAFPTGWLFPAPFCPSKSYHPWTASSLNDYLYVRAFLHSSAHSDLALISSSANGFYGSYCFYGVHTLLCSVMLCVGPAHPEVGTFFEKTEQNKNKRSPIFVFSVTSTQKLNNWW